MPKNFVARVLLMICLCPGCGDDGQTIVQIH